MMIIITGTPGCGKTTISKILSEKINAKLISINSLLEEYDLSIGIDEKRGYTEVNTVRMIPIVDEIKEKCKNQTIIFEGHLAQDYPSADKIVVLRCNPLILKERLQTRKWKDEKIDENISAEILGICTQESYETYGDIIQEVETSNKTPDEIVEIIIDIINNKKQQPLGQIDYLNKYFKLLN